MRANDFSTVSSRLTHVYRGIKSFHSQRTTLLLPLRAYNRQKLLNLHVDFFSCRPEEARIPVPDARFDWLCDLYKPSSRVPAFLTTIDIAGLVSVS